MYEDESIRQSNWVERILAIALVIFLFMGGIWILQWLGTIPERPDFGQYFETQEFLEARDASNRAADAYWQAEQHRQQRAAAYDQAQAQYMLAAEDLESAREAGAPTAETEARYEAARAVRDESERLRDAANRVAGELEAERDGASSRMDQLDRESRERWESAQFRYESTVFALRMLYALPLFFLTLWLWRRQRDQRHPYLILYTAFLAFAALQLLGVVSAYAIEVFADLAQIIVSVFGSLGAIAGLISIRRYFFNPRRVRERRLREGGCTECGAPVPDPEAHYCRICGEALTEACHACGEPRHRHAAYCSHCGAGPLEAKTGA